VIRVGGIRVGAQTGVVFFGLFVLVFVGVTGSGLPLPSAASDGSIGSPDAVEMSEVGVAEGVTDGANASAALAPEGGAALVATVASFLDAVSDGDMARALACVADDAIFQSGMQPFVVGAEAIGASLAALAGDRTEMRLLSTEVGGSTVRSQVVVSSDVVRRAGFDRVVWAINWGVHDGQITAVVSAYDMSDAETRRYVTLATAGDGSIVP
jgi:hypothetical protein